EQLKAIGQPKEKTTATRQLKRKNGQPPKSEAKLVGPVMIRKQRERQTNQQ
ncbi:hypothetical protein DFH28DRAFT_838959, partial [Melampsora americana]